MFFKFREAIFVILFAYIATCYSDEETNKYTEVDIKPGAGKQDVTISLDGVECVFTYMAQGGTKEQWGFSISRAENAAHYKCVIERPSGTSYLFFEQFRFSFVGAHLDKIYAEKEPDMQLGPTEYAIQKQDNYVASVAGKFDNKLSRIAIYGNRGRTEL